MSFDDGSMLIHLISPSLPPALDGIGDYTSKLAAELVRSERVAIVCAADRTEGPPGAIAGVEIRPAFSARRRRSVMRIADVIADGRPDWARVALGAVAPTVIRAPRTEAALLEGGYEGLTKAIQIVPEEARPIDDIRSTRDYRRAMTGVLLQRAIRTITEG